MPRTATLVPEVPLVLEVNGAPWAAWSASPGGLRTLALGRMVAEGLVAGPADLLGLEEGDAAAEGGAGPASAAEAAAAVRVRARVSEDALARARAEQRGRAGDGLAWYLAPGRLGEHRRTLPLPSSDALRELFRQLFAGVDEEHPGGGVHGALLTDGADVRALVADVGKHNTVDRLVGWMVEEGLDAGGMGLVMTARVSAEVAHKAVRGGVAWVASRSAVMALGARLAEAGGLPIVARAAGSGAEVLGAAPPTDPEAEGTEARP